MPDLSRYDLVIVDVGGTLVREAVPGTPTSELTVEVLPGVLDDLAALRTQVRLAAATNTAVMTADDVGSLLEPSGVARHLELIVTSVDVGAAKPDPTMLEVVLERCGGIPASRALFIGDRDTDEQAARAVGMPFAWVHPCGLVAAIARYQDTTEEP